MNAGPKHFVLAARLLHWSMAVAIVAMLFIGVSMVSTVGWWHPRLLALHRPLGIAILLLAAIRLAVRLTNPPPPLPADLPGLQKLMATASHWLLYALMIAMPLVGWAMVSASGTPVMLTGSIRLFPIAPHDIALYGILRQAHTVLGIALFLVFVAHMSAALLHGLIRRDGVFDSMALHPFRRRPARL
ncbi:MAG: cytochrome b [Janthinobacterium lividum]